MIYSFKYEEENDMKEQKPYQKVFKIILKESTNKRALNRTKANRILIAKLRAERAKIRV